MVPKALLPLLFCLFLQGRQTLFFLLNLELRDSQMLLGAVIFAALNIGVSGLDHVSIVIVLEDTILPMATTVGVTGAVA